MAKLHRFSGAVLLATHGHVLLSKGYGSADYSTGRPNTADTPMRLGSVTKTLIAVAIFQLARAQRLQLDSTVCAYLTTCPSSWRQVTPRMLLEHTAGLSTKWDGEDWRLRARISLPSAIHQLEELPLEFTPGSRWEYCNACYILAGYLIERIAHEPWPDYLGRRIFQPAGMRNSGYCTVLRDAARGYTSDRLGSTVAAPYEALASRDPAGGICASANDLFRFSQALNSNLLLDARSRSEMFRPTLTSHRQWSAGWEVGSRNRIPVVRHTGSVAGWASTLSRFANGRLTLIVLSNRSDTSIEALSHDLASIALGWPYTQPVKPALLRLDRSALARFVGRYATTGTERLRLQIHVVRTSLVLYPGPDGGGDPLWPVAPNVFLDSVDPRWKATFTSNANGDPSILTMRNTSRGGSLIAHRVGYAAPDPSVPAPPGPYEVGTYVTSISEQRRLLFVPRGVSKRRLRVQVFYPASTARGHRARLLPAAVAAVVASEGGVSRAGLQATYANARVRTRPAKGRFPVILFSPGYAVPSGLYTALLEGLASQGFVVVSFDHTYETAATVFPDGEVVHATLPEVAPSGARLGFAIISAREGDVDLVRRELPVITQFLHGAADRSRIGIFGHSLGGLTAAHAVANGGFTCGADLDGSVYSLRRPIAKPFLVMTHSRKDSTLARLWGALHAERHWLVLRGAEHLDFTDWAWLYPALPHTGHSSIANLLGPIRGTRAVLIQRAYLGAFFGHCLGGKDEPLLSAANSPYPEIAPGRTH